MKIYLLRHGNASNGYPDSSRTLSLEGRAEVTNLAQYLKKSGHAMPKLVWHSPYRRAVETMEIFLKITEPEGVQVHMRENITPEDNLHALIEALSELQEDLLIVGHNPFLSILTSLLVSGERSRIRIHLPTSGLVCLECAPIGNFGQLGPCMLSWMLDPKLLVEEADAD